MIYKGQKIRLIVFFTIYFLSKICFSQFTIGVTDALKQPISNATIVVEKKGTVVFQDVTNEKGQTIFNGQTGEYMLYVRTFLFDEAVLKFEVNEYKRTMDVTLTKSQIELKEVVINGSSRLQRKKESLYTPEILDLKSVKNTSKTVTEAINLSSGLRIQQQGGIGSELKINLNGIDGKGVRVFIDEIPVYLLGKGFNIQNLTTNNIDYIETYKGLIPVKFGSDILGGVINIVTKKNKKYTFEVGYSYGSWNYNEATLNIFSQPFKQEKVFIGFDIVYSHSDNDYWMDDVDVVVDDNYNTKKGRARRFNDAYDYGLLKLQTGLKNLSWSNKIKLTTYFNFTNKEWQHGITALNPWGEPFSKEYTTGTALNWKKLSSEKGKWEMDVTTGYNFEHSYFEDTASRTYFWDGNFIKKQNKGESGLYSQGRTPKINQNVLYARGNFLFKIKDNHKFNLNILTTKRTLKGEDKAGTVTYKKDPFKTPQILINNFIGGGIESRFFKESLISNTSFKYFFSKVKGINFKINNEFDKINSLSSSDIGFGQVFKWKLSSNTTLFSGYEYTVRQPDNREIFGDYITVRPNPNLKSAKSNNVNLKAHFKSENRKVFTGIGGFYRDTKNRIILTSFANGLAACTNLLRTSTIGAEYFLNYKINNNFNFNFNATYIDTRLKAVDDFGIFTKEYVGARIPNTPYLFGNLQMSYTLTPKKNKNYYINFLSTISYVDDYFLTWEINGKKQSKVTTPSQLVSDISIAIYPKNRRCNFAFDCKNLTNETVYDNFSVQKAGRSFYGKITYQLK